MRVDPPARGVGRPDRDPTGVAKTKTRSEDGFRSPATANALDRLGRKLLRGLDGETRDRIEALLEEVRAKAVELAASDTRPYGRSVEHDLKQLLIAAANRRLAAAAYEPPLPEPVDVLPVAEEPAPVEGPPSIPEGDATPIDTSGILGQP